MIYSVLEIELTLSETVIPVDIEVSCHDLEIDIEFYSEVVQKSGLEDYAGDYEVTPLITTQILPTADKHMLDDLTINMIPTRELDNSSGGVTFIIGG